MDLSVVLRLAEGDVAGIAVVICGLQVCWQGWSDFNSMIEQVLEKAQ